jgi:hypothetical protein
MDVDEGGWPGPDGGWCTPELEIVRDSIVREAIDELDRPHIVLIHDGQLDLTLVLGPFPDALTAAVAAHDQRREDERELGDSTSRSYDVHVLLPPIPVAV